MVLHADAGIPSVYRSECTKWVFVELMTISYQMQGILSLTVAFDRFLAVTIPIKYIKFGNIYNFFIIATPCVTVLVPTVVNFILTVHDHSFVSSLCLTREAVYPGFHSYILIMRMVCIISSGLLYLHIVLRLKQHVAKHEKAWHRVRYGAAAEYPAFYRLTTMNALVFLFIPDILAYFEIAGIHKKYATVLYALYCVNVRFMSFKVTIYYVNTLVNLNFMILITRHKEIRQNISYFIRVILCRRTISNTNANNYHKPPGSNIVPMAGSRLPRPD
ncbi:hypothetical protein OSTOST_04848, partial [Ostertagia ostertagi]